ncbi:NAD-dependent epimerase/dehydratase family protein [Chitinophagaceae bacterium MMS25-I14]
MITVLGHAGFIGSQIVQELQQRNLEYFLPGRDEDLKGKNLGKVIFCIGLTADAKKKPFDTIEAHINKLSEIIRYSQFDDITYASSARVYVHGTGLASETGNIAVDVADPFELFNLTKLTAESLLRNTVPHFKSVRYANVYGLDIHSENFLTSIISEAIARGTVTLHTTPDSAKDYISLRDAASLTVDIALRGTQQIYNVASGINTTNKQITDRIAQVLNCEIVYSDQAKQIIFPPIDTAFIRREFNFRPSNPVSEDIDLLIAAFKKELSSI